MVVYRKLQIFLATQRCVHTANRRSVSNHPSANFRCLDFKCYKTNFVSSFTTLGYQRWREISDLRVTKNIHLIQLFVAAVRISHLCLRNLNNNLLISGTLIWLSLGQTILRASPQGQLWWSRWSFKQEQVTGESGPLFVFYNLCSPESNSLILSVNNKSVI